MDTGGTLGLKLMTLSALTLTVDKQSEEAS